MCFRLRIELLFKDTRPPQSFVYAPPLSSLQALPVLARNALSCFQNMAPHGPEREPLGIDRLRFSEGTVDGVGDRRDGGQVRHAHRSPAARHGWSRKGATTCAVTRSGRPLALSSNAPIVRTRTWTRPSGPVNSISRSNFAPAGLSAHHVPPVPASPGPTTRTKYHPS